MPVRLALALFLLVVLLTGGALYFLLELDWNHVTGNIFYDATHIHAEEHAAAEDDVTRIIEGWMEMNGDGQ